MGSGAPKFGSEQRKFLEFKEFTPGPGDYNARGIDISSPEGRCHVSTYKTIVANRFSNLPRPFSALISSRYEGDTVSESGKRYHNVNRRTPGPGDYNRVSEFGRYRFYEPLGSTTIESDFHKSS